jgi:topoisomerase-4 subunit A
MLGDPDAAYVLATDAGYGFRAKLDDLQTRNKNGKVVLSVPNGAKVLTPEIIDSTEMDCIAAVSTSGRLLVTALNELPVLAKGKGLKIIQIPPAKLKAREEYVVALCAFKTGDSLLLHSGKRQLTLKPAVLENFRGERGRRGNMLPRGFRQISRIEVAGTQTSQVTE